jgi:beta-glucanase (GH16 family)
MKKVGFVLWMLLSFQSHAQWTLIWNDEFDGNTLDNSKWTKDIGGNGWGNNEAQYYTDSPTNFSIANGEATFTARAEQFSTNQYTSAKITTKGKFNVKYGKIEGRMKIPQGQGLWPAFWMLGSNIDQMTWPTCGEIDVMEHINNETKVHGTAHWDNVGHQYWGGTIDNDPTQYHTYSIIWDSLKVKWYMDDIIYYQLNIANGVNGTEEFQLPFYLLLNLAVGGNWPGYPNGTTVFPAEMVVDYVRVYTHDANAGIATEGTPEYTLSPNPVGNQLYLNTENIVSYRINSIDGKTHDEASISKGTEFIDVTQLAPGNYLLEIETIHSKKSIVRFVKQ